MKKRVNFIYLNKRELFNVIHLVMMSILSSHSIKRWRKVAESCRRGVEAEQTIINSKLFFKLRARDIFIVNQSGLQIIYSLEWNQDFNEVHISAC